MIHLRPFFIDTEYGRYRISYHYNCINDGISQIFLTFPHKGDGPDKAKYGYIVIESTVDSGVIFSIYSTSFKEGFMPFPCKDLLHLYMKIADSDILVSAEAISILIKEAAKHKLKIKQ